ncbi:MAG: 2-dehydropantoate 2-reductase [Chloroflexi bacterium]|nr:2-dehydropantoate 2-reductase [Chloroflexota bacterium]
MSDSILIVGTGALGSLFAARLAAAGAEVTMLGTWREGLAALRQHGVTLVQADGSQKAYPVRATHDPKTCEGARYSLVLVKSWQTERAAGQLAECLDVDGVALTLQNGLGNQEILAEALGVDRVALGVTTTGATLLSSGRVRPGGEGVVSVGEHPRLEPLVKLLKGAGFNVEVLAGVDTLIWSKLVINAAINPVTALLRMPNGEILQRPSARLLSASLAAEVAELAAAQHIELSFADPVGAAEGVAERTASNNSSMLQDVQRGAPTEIDAICGAVVASGEKIGISTPANQVVWQLVRALREAQSE